MFAGGAGLTAFLIHYLSGDSITRYHCCNLCCIAEGLLSIVHIAALRPNAKMKALLLTVALFLLMFRLGDGCGWAIPTVPVSCGCSAPAVQNSCCGRTSCGGCYTRRRLTTRRRTRDVTHEYTTISESGDDPICNSEQLRIIIKNVS